MKTLYLILLLFILNASLNSQFIRQQISLEGNNIRTFIWNTGVFNQDLRTVNTPGFEWPKGTGKAACYTAGLCIGGYVNNELRLGTASYSGEFRPGYCSNGQFFTDSRFKHFKVKRGDNYITNPDWLNWGLMVPFGAPYVDVNNNGGYDYFVDTPGVRSSSETVFICITDGDSLRHTSSEGFSGGTKPLYSEVHLTAWCYDLTGLTNVQFIRWEIINRSNSRWDSVYFSLTSDVDLGDANDDYTGCDTTRNLLYCYNGDNTDGTGTGVSYGSNPPAFGYILLKGAVRKDVLPYINLNAATLRVWHKSVSFCDRDPNTPNESYNMFKGLKNDGTSWVIPFTSPPVRTKFTYSGDPETIMGWTEYTGRIQNCYDSLTGQLISPSPPGDRRMMLSSGSSQLRMNTGDTQVICIAQLIVRGSSNLNSVTLLKQLAGYVINYYNENIIGIQPISIEVPGNYSLSQNYPNPFNPNTIIRFNIRDSRLTTLRVFDALGGEIATLVNEQLNPGTYEINWDGTNYPSGIYFCRLESKDYSYTIKMVLVK